MLWPLSGADSFRRPVVLAVFCQHVVQVHHQLDVAVCEMVAGSIEPFYDFVELPCKAAHSIVLTLLACFIGRTHVVSAFQFFSSPDCTANFLSVNGFRVDASCVWGRIA